MLSFHSLFFVFIQQRRRARFFIFHFPSWGGGPCPVGSALRQSHILLGTYSLPKSASRFSTRCPPDEDISWPSTIIEFREVALARRRSSTVGMKKKKWMLTLPKRKGGGRERGNEEEKIKRDAAHASRPSREHLVQRWLKIRQPHQLPTWHVVL